MSNQKDNRPPWEISVFAALLNTRWAHHIKSTSQEPDPVHALDGESETALGDIILKENDRLFLFELKSHWSRARTELKKPIFDRYKALHDHALAHPQSHRFDKFLLQSIRCHHLAYWEDKEVLIDGLVRGSISFSPYALYVLDRLASMKSSAVDYRHSHALSSSKGGQTSIVEAASIKDLFDQSAKAVSGDLIAGLDVRFSELGLNQRDFLDFVTTLRGQQDAGDISLNLIAYSPVSGFVRSVNSLDQAVQLGSDWAAGTASSKPTRQLGAQRTGKPRVIGSNPLICSPAPIKRPAPGRKPGTSRP